MSSPPAGSHPLTVVTVLYEAETGLAGLQGRSLALNSREIDSMIDRILIIDNTAWGLSTHARSRIKRNYGALAERVEMVRGRELASDVQLLDGWRAQQVLKLQVSESIDTRHYLVLDAKNHLVAPLRPSFLFGPEGRPRVPAYSYRSHPHGQRLDTTLRFFGVDPKHHLSHFTATVTPFVLQTDLVRQMLKEVRAMSDESLTETFLRNDVTEFFMYSSWILATGRPLDTVMDLVSQSSQTIWGGGTSPTRIEETLRQNDTYESPFLSIHRSAYLKLDKSASRLVAQYWSRHGLFDNTDQAQKELRRIRRGISRGRAQAALRQRWPLVGRSRS